MIGSTRTVIPMTGLSGRKPSVRRQILRVGVQIEEYLDIGSDIFPFKNYPPPTHLKCIMVGCQFKLICINKKGFAMPMVTYMHCYVCDRCVLSCKNIDKYLT